MKSEKVWRIINLASCSVSIVLSILVASQYKVITLQIPYLFIKSLLIPSIAIAIFSVLLLDNFLFFRKVIKLKGLDSVPYFESNSHIAKDIQKYGIFKSVLKSFIKYTAIIIFLCFVPFGEFIIMFIAGYFTFNLIHDLQMNKQLEPYLRELKEKYVT